MDKQLYRIIFLVVAFIFILGIAAGALLVCRMDTGEGSELRSFVEGYTGLLQEGSAASTPLWRSFLGAFLFPALAFLSGFTLLGVASIPILLFARGFLLSFSVTSFVVVYGINGLWLALGELGIQCVLGVPCLIVVSVYGAHMTLRLVALARGRLAAVGGTVCTRAFQPDGGWIRIAACVVAMTACALADTYLSPWLRGWISSLVFQ